MVNHPDEGTLRAWIDGEAPESAQIEAHLGECATCRDDAAVMRENAGLAGDAIRQLAPVGARPRLRVVETPPARRSSSRWRVAAAGLAAALALGVVVGTSDGRTAAASFLAQFRSQSIQPITIDPNAIGGSPLGQLGRLGTVSGDHSPRPETVGSLADLSAKVGFAVRQPNPTTLPSGLPATPVYRVIPAHELRFTFDEAKARAYFAEIGRSNVVVPPKFNGASLVVSVPAAAVLQYGSPNGQSDPRSVKALLIGQSGEITAGTEGNVTLDEMRDFLLGLPGLPPDVVRQLRDVRDWRTTLPLPIPADQVSSQQTTVAGGPGLLLVERHGLGNALVWQGGGRVNGVAGTFDAGQLQRVADSLR